LDCRILPKGFIKIEEMHNDHNNYTGPQKQGLVENVGAIFEVCENDCIRYIATLSDKEGFFVPEVAVETEAKKKQ
jgi:hypothetical protein